MAYDRRISELKDGLRSIAPDESDPGYKALKDSLDRYAELRSKALDDIIYLIYNSTIGASSIQDHWQSIARRAQEDSNRIFGDSVKEVMLIPAFQAYWAKMVDVELPFFDRLSSVRTPQYIEDILTHQGKLAEMIDKLQNIWNGLLSADKDQENAQIQVVKTLDDMIQALAKELENQNVKVVAEAAHDLQERMKNRVERIKSGIKSKLGEKGVAAATMAYKVAVAVVKDNLGYPTEVDDDFEVQKKRLELYAEQMKAFNQAYRDNVAKYRDLMSIEKGGVLTMFKDTRAQVREYEEKNGLVVAQIMRDEAKRFLNEWASGCYNDQRDDAEEFNRKIFDIIDKNWKVTEEMAKRFEEKFSGVFYSPLTRDTMETLTESYMMRQAIDNVNNRNIATTIDNSQKLLTGSVDEMVKTIMQPLDEMPTDWSDDMKALAEVSNEDFRKYMKEKLKSQVDLALNFLGELRGLIDPPKVVADFTREELDAMLRD